MKNSLIFQKVEEYLQKEILRILKKEFEPPEKYTILGSDINEIRHIFYYLKSHRTPITVYYLIETYTGFIVEVYDTIFQLQIVGFEESTLRRCRIGFNFLNIYYQFEVNISHVEKDNIFLYIPLNIQYTSQRKFPRYYPEQLYTKLNIIYNNLFSEKQYEQILIQNYPKIIDEFNKDLPDLHLILRIIFSELEKITPNYTIDILLKEHKTLEFLIKQLQIIKKPIYIENTDNLTSYYYPVQSTLLSNFERMHKTMLKAKTEEDVIKFFESIQKKDIREQKNSYIITPILVFDELIGYIYLETSYIERKKIFLDDAIKIAMLSRILSYTLERIIFYNAYYMETNAIVRNISLSGILIKIQSQKIYQYLINNDLLKLELELYNQNAQLLGIITRMFTISENEFNIALEFFEYIGDSFKVLENFIFEIQKTKQKRGQ